MDDAMSYHDAQREHPSERLDAMQRTLTKALSSSRHNDFYNTDYNNNDNNNASNNNNTTHHAHPQIDELVNTIILTLSRQGLQYLKELEGEAAMACVIAQVARAASRFVVTEPAKVAIRASAQEAMAGLWDGFHHKVDDIVMKMPRVVLWLGLLVVGTYGVLVAVGLLLCLWRFASMASFKSATFVKDHNEKKTGDNMEVS